MSAFQVAQRYMLRYKKLMIPKYSSRLIIIRKLSNWMHATKTRKLTVSNMNYNNNKICTTQFRKSTTNTFKKPNVNPPYLSLCMAGIVGILLSSTMIVRNIKINLNQNANNMKYAVTAAVLWGNSEYASKSRPTAVVTGASSGIGASIANKLLSENWNVVLIARSMDKMEEITKKYRNDQYLNIKCDVSNSTECIEACKTINKWSNGKIHLLLNNAGCLISSAMEDEKLEDHQYMLRVNVTAPYVFTKHLAPCLKEGASNPFNDKYQATVVNVSSIGALSAYYNGTTYDVSKAALESLTRNNALELAKYNIRVNAIRLGFIDTKFLHPEIVKLAPVLNPIGRIGYTSDVDELILFLADKTKSGFMTGSIVQCDGGFLLIDAFGNPNNTQQESGLDSNQL